MILATEFRGELIASDVFVAPNATVLGNVHIGEASSVWYQAVIRGDTDRIRIGKQTNVQDGCVLHTDPGMSCILGDRVTVGHGAIVHGAEVGNDVLIGMRAVVMNGASIGEGSIVAVGAVVTEGTEIPSNSLVMGVPGKIVRQTTEQDRERIIQAAQHYVAAAKQFRLAIDDVADDG